MTSLKTVTNLTKMTKVSDNYHCYILDKSDKCIYDPAENQQIPKEQQVYYRACIERGIPSQSQIIYRPWAQEKQKQHIEWLKKSIEEEVEGTGCSVNDVLYYGYKNRFKMEGGCGMLCLGWLKYSPNYNKKKHRLVIGDIGFIYKENTYWIKWGDDEMPWERKERLEKYKVLNSDRCNPNHHPDP